MSVSLREDSRWSVLENKLLRRIVGPWKEEEEVVMS
jgi:hypothetical protein